MFKELAPEIDYYRKKAGELIRCVLAKRMPVRQALLAYPKDVLDKSVQASWHALCHLEADSELSFANSTKNPKVHHGEGLTASRSIACTHQ